MRPTLSPKTKVMALALLNQYGNKVLVGFDIDELGTTQMHSKHMLLVGGLRRLRGMREGESRELVRQFRVNHAVEVADSLTPYFENICTNPDSGTENV
jgi:hypothetical protein